MICERCVSQSNVSACDEYKKTTSVVTRFAFAPVPNYIGNRDAVVQQIAYSSTHPQTAVVPTPHGISVIRDMYDYEVGNCSLHEVVSITSHVGSVDGNISLYNSNRSRDIAEINNNLQTWHQVVLKSRPLYSLCLNKNLGIR